MLALQLLLFVVFYAREIAWYPPLNFDQTEYLTQAYQIQERALWQGTLKLWNNLSSRGHATGLGLPIEGAISGHGISAEKEVRALELGINDLPEHLLFYPISVIRDHLGAAFISAAALAFLVAIVLRLLNRERISNDERRVEKPESPLLQIIFLLGAIAGPLIVLTIDISKSPVAGGIVGVPMALLVVRLAATTLAEDFETSSPPYQTLCGAVAGLIFVIGLLNFAGHATRHLPQSGQRRYYMPLHVTGRSRRSLSTPFQAT